MTILVAVSGGADSVALVRGLVEIRAPGCGGIAIAHFNHGLRGGASEADAEFVARLADDLAIDFHLGQARSALPSGGDGLEAAARQARYEFLVETAERLGARYVVTAHTADDQAETILHHALRGSGLAGIAGMPRARLLSRAATLIRPLLEISRGEVVDFLRLLNQDWREDLSNFDTDLTRNRIRHELLPLLAREYCPGVSEALLRLGRIASEAQAALELLANELLDAVLSSVDGGGATIECHRLVGRPRHLVREMFVALWRQCAWPRQDMAWRHWEALASLALGDAKEAEVVTLPGPVVARRVAQQLALSCPALSAQ